jgi:hypothetical protein
VVSSRPETGGFPSPEEAEGVTSLADVCAAQGREARQGPRQGELPGSLPASLSGSLSLSVIVSQPEWFVAERVRSVPDLASSPLAALRTSSSERRGVGGQRRPRGLPPATVQVTARYPGGLPG